MLLKGIVTILILTASYSFATQIIQCKSGGKIVPTTNEDVDFNKCEAPPCPCKRGTDIYMSMKFVPETAVEKIYIISYGTLMGVKKEFDGANGKNGCDFLINEDGSKASCPLTPGVQYTYYHPFPVKNTYPKVTVMVRWGLKDKATNTMLACMEQKMAIV